MEEECEDLPVWVGGTQRWVTGLTRRTTADDVIYALLFNDGLHETENTEDYAIFERWREVERPLQPRTKILKIWRAWGQEQPNVQLSMRRLDDYFMPGDHPRSRRRRRSRHRHSRQCRNSPHREQGRSRSVESLVRLVVSQERQVQELMARLRSMDDMIESYETRIHQRRSQLDGSDYVQAAYLDSLSEDSMEDFLAGADRQQLQEYLTFCDKVIVVEQQLQAKHAAIQDLTLQIEHARNESAVHSESLDETILSGDPQTMEAEVEKVRREVNRLANTIMLQRYQELQVMAEIQDAERVCAERKRALEAVQQELLELKKAQEAEAQSTQQQQQQQEHQYQQHQQQQQQQQYQQHERQHQQQPQQTQHLHSHGQSSDAQQQQQQQQYQHQYQHHEHQYQQQHQQTQHLHSHGQSSDAQQQQQQRDYHQSLHPHHWQPQHHQPQDLRHRQWDAGQHQSDRQQQQWGQHPHHYPQSVQQPLHVQGYSDSVYSYYSGATVAGAGNGDVDFGDYTYLAEEASSPDSGMGEGAGPRDPRETRDPRDEEEDDDDDVSHIHVLDKPPTPTASPARPSRSRIIRKTQRARSRSRSRNREEPWWQSAPGSVNCDGPEGAYHVPSASVRDTSRSRDEEDERRGSTKVRDEPPEVGRKPRRDSSEDRARGSVDRDEKGHVEENGLQYRWDWDNRYHPTRSYLSLVPRDAAESGVPSAEQRQSNGFQENSRRDRARELTSVTGKPSQGEVSNQTRSNVRKNGMSDSNLKDVYHQYQNGVYPEKYHSSGSKLNGVSVPPQTRQRLHSEKSGGLVSPRVEGNHKGGKSVHFVFDEADKDGGEERRRAGAQQSVAQTSDKGPPPPYAWHCRTQSSLGPADSLAKSSKDDSDSNSDTGLSSMHSDEAPYLETLV